MSFCKDPGPTSLTSAVRGRSVSSQEDALQFLTHRASSDTFIGSPVVAIVIIELR